MTLRNRDDTENCKRKHFEEFAQEEATLLLLLSNFSLLSFGWEIFTYPGMY